MHLKDTGPRQVICLLVFIFKSCPEEPRILIEEVLKMKISQGDKHLNKYYKGTNQENNQVSSDKKKKQTENLRENMICPMSIFLHFKHLLLKIHFGENLLLVKK